MVSLKPMLSLAHARGVNTAALLSGVGLLESGLDDIDRRIPESERAHLWREVAVRSDDTEFWRFGDDLMYCTAETRRWQA